MRVLFLSLLLCHPGRRRHGEAVQNHIRPGFAGFADAARDPCRIDSCDPDTLRPAFHVGL